MKRKTGALFLVFSLFVLVFFNAVPKIAFADDVSLNNPTEDGLINFQSGSSYDRDTVGTLLIIGSAVEANEFVFRSYVEWDVSSIQDGSTVTYASLKFHCWYDRGGRSSGIFAMASQPSVSSDAVVWADMGDGTQYVAYNGFVPASGANKEQDLGGDVLSDIEDALAGDWFAIGMRADTEVPDPFSHKYEGLYLVYIVLIDLLLSYNPLNFYLNGISLLLFPHLN